MDRVMGEGQTDMRLLLMVVDQLPSYLPTTTNSAKPHWRPGVLLRWSKAGNLPLPVKGQDRNSFQTTTPITETNWKETNCVTLPTYHTTPTVTFCKRRKKKKKKKKRRNSKSRVITPLRPSHQSHEYITAICEEQSATHTPTRHTAVTLTGCLARLSLSAFRGSTAYTGKLAAAGGRAGCGRNGSCAFDGTPRPTW